MLSQVHWPSVALAIPFNWTEAVAERIISVFWDFPPKLELQRDGNAILHLPCDNRSSPSGWPDVHRTELFTFQEPYRVHGNVKLSNILIGEAGDHFLAYLDSSVEIGAELVTKTLNSSQRGTVGTERVHLLGLESAEDRLEREEVGKLLRTIVNPSLNIKTIVQKLA
eukprot:gene28280-37206_t